jgi:hypothetical protein
MKKDTRKRNSIVSVFGIALLLCLLAFFSSTAARLRLGFFEKASSPYGINPQENRKPTPPRRPSGKEREQQGLDHRNRFPTVDYDAAEPTDPTERAKRKLKGSRHNQRGFVQRQPSESTAGTIRIDESDMDLPALPTAESDAVVIGTMLNSKAYLSNDRTGVYSEFAVQLSDVLKCNRADLLEGSVVLVSREGGIVKYPSGHTHLYAISERNMPKLNANYLLFLKTIQGTTDYEIITAYELDSERVIPLDGGMKFKRYAQVDKPSFLSFVRDALASPK